MLTFCVGEGPHKGPVDSPSQAKVTEGQREGGVESKVNQGDFDGHSNPPGLCGKISFRSGQLSDSRGAVFLETRKLKQAGNVRSRNSFHETPGFGQSYVAAQTRRGSFILTKIFLNSKSWRAFDVRGRKINFR